MGGVALRGEGSRMAEEILNSGRAHKKLMEIIESQGGNPEIKSGEIHICEHQQEVLAPNTGYVVAFDNKRIVEIARTAGAPMDKGAGVIIHKKMGELVKKGEPLMTICASTDWDLECATKECALREAQKAVPIIVEGMLLERYPRLTEI
jgi:AMP phosphorylase